MDAWLALGLVLLVLIIYFLPSLVATNRGKKHSEAIFVLNLFLGWTILGWVAALVWSVADEPLISDRKVSNAVGNTRSSGFDRPKWNALLQYDADIAAAEKEIRPLGQEWVDELGSAYMALNDKAYLRDIVEKIKVRAEGLAQAREDNKKEYDQLIKAEEEKHRQRIKSLNDFKYPIAGVIAALVFVLCVLYWRSASESGVPSKEEQQQSALALGSGLANMNYPAAREILKNQGWEPVTLADSDCKIAPNDLNCVGRFAEVASCSADGYCKYAWRRQGALIGVSTHNNAPDPDTVIGVEACEHPDTC
jgi:Superinfection immunity protein